STRLFWYVDGVLVKDGTGGAARWFKTVWNTPGTYELCFDASQEPCIDVSDQPEPTCITIEVYEIPPTPIDATVCPGETFEYNGIPYGPGDYTVEFVNDDGCDSLILINVQSFPTPETDLGVIELCEGECY